MIRLLRPEEVHRHLGLCLNLNVRWLGRSLQTEEYMRRFLEADALIYHVLADIDSDGLQPFVPRAHLGLMLMSQDEYLAFQNGKPFVELQPYTRAMRQAGVPMSCFVSTVYSQVPLGLPKLLVACLEDLRTHPALPLLREVFWFTRTAKGFALGSIFAGSATGYFYVSPLSPEARFPFFAMNSPDWEQSISERLLHLADADADFATELMQGYQIARSQWAG